LNNIFQTLPVNPAIAIAVSIMMISVRMESIVGSDKKMPNAVNRATKIAIDPIALAGVNKSSIVDIFTRSA